MTTPTAASRWLVLALLIVSLSAFVYSLRLRARDWGGVHRPAAVAEVSAISWSL